MDHGQRRLEYGTSLAEAIANLTPIARESLIDRGSFLLKVADTLQ